MRLFLPALAVAVGLVNALLLGGFDDSPWGGLFTWEIQHGPLFTAHMLSAVLAGLIVSGALLLFADRKLRGASSPVTCSCGRRSAVEGRSSACSGAARSSFST